MSWNLSPGCLHQSPPILTASHDLFNCTAAPHSCWTVSQICKVAFGIHYQCVSRDHRSKTVKCRLSHVTCHKGPVYLLEWVHCTDWTLVTWLLQGLHHRKYVNCSVYCRVSNYCSLASFFPLVRVSSYHHRFSHPQALRKVNWETWCFFHFPSVTVKSSQAFL